MDIGKLVNRVKGLPVIRQVVAVQQRYGEDGAGLYASAIAFHAFFSLFPLLLISFAVLGFVYEDPASRRELVERAAGSLPGLGDLIGDSLDAMVNAREATGIFGLLGFAWTGTGVVRAAGAALTRMFRVELPDDNILKQNGWALGALASLALVAAVSTGISTLGNNLPSGNVAASIGLVALGLVFDLVLFIFAYRVLTRGGGPGLRALLPGAAFAALGWTALKFIGSWYARRTVTGATAVYGSFAGAVGIMVLLSLGARIFLYGAVINAIRLRLQPSLQTDVMQMEAGEPEETLRADDRDDEDRDDEDRDDENDARSVPRRSA